jgi:hypothetical protein
MRKDEDDDDNKGKAYKEVTYLFTSNGDYAAVKPEDADFSLMIYSKKGYTWIIDDNKKTITVMSMPKTVGEGAAMGKGIAEDIKKAPLEISNGAFPFLCYKKHTIQLQRYNAFISFVHIIWYLIQNIFRSIICTISINQFCN